MDRDPATIFFYNKLMYNNPMDFNNYQITLADLRQLSENPEFNYFLNGKLKELYYTFNQKYPSLDYSHPETFLEIPETAFILAGKVLELKTLLKKPTE